MSLKLRSFERFPAVHVLVGDCGVAPDWSNCCITVHKICTVRLHAEAKLVGRVQEQVLEKGAEKRKAGARNRSSSWHGPLGPTQRKEASIVTMGDTLHAR